MKKHDVFVSYQQSDKRIAEGALSALEAAGLSCWIAPRDVRVGGEGWGADILDAIKSSRTMLVVFSSASNDSPYILREVNEAVESRMPMVLFRVEDVKPKRSLEFYLDVVQWMDAFPSPEGKYAELTKTLKLLASDDEKLRETVEEQELRRKAFVEEQQRKEQEEREKERRRQEEQEELHRRRQSRQRLVRAAGLLAAVVIVGLVSLWLIDNQGGPVDTPPTPPPSPTQSPTATPAEVNSNHNGVATPTPTTGPSQTPSPGAPAPLTDATAQRITELAGYLFEDRYNEAHRRDAIFEMERHAKKDLKYHQAVVDHLAGFIRKQTTYDRRCSELNPPAKPVHANVQEALDVLGRRKWWYGNGESIRINLEGVDLRGANFRMADTRKRAHFQGVILRGACLDDAKLWESDFRCANLTGASARGIEVNGTDFWGADLSSLKNASEPDLNMAARRGGPSCAHD